MTHALVAVVKNIKSVVDKFGKKEFSQQVIQRDRLLSRRITLVWFATLLLLKPFIGRHRLPVNSPLGAKRRTHV